MNNEKIYRYIYKITCTKGKLTNCYYYGQHSTRKLNDGYKGSGKIIVDYYKKYPNDYKKEIIAFYNTSDELDEAEKKIILEHIEDDKCINICNGGIWGGFKGMSEADKKLMYEHQRAALHKYWENEENHIITKEKRQKTFDENPLIRDKIMLSVHKYWENEENHKKLEDKNEQHKIKIKQGHKSQRQSLREYYLNNPFAIIEKSKQSSNSCWIKKDNIEKFILKTEAQNYIDNGWQYGRLPSKLKDIPRTEELKIKVSEALKGKYCGENHPMYGKHHREESKQQMSESKKGTHRVYDDNGKYHYEKNI